MQPFVGGGGKRGEGVTIKPFGGGGGGVRKSIDAYRGFCGREESKRRHVRKDELEDGMAFHRSSLLHSVANLWHTR